ncbi:MAG: hypothetical protein ACI8WB_003328 [Phenylobacterium sp.]|jgi:hypothetical protein
MNKRLLLICASIFTLSAAMTSTVALANNQDHQDHQHAEKHDSKHDAKKGKTKHYSTEDVIKHHSTDEHSAERHSAKHSPESHSSDHKKAKHHQTLNLSPALQSALNLEMQQIKMGMESLVFATVSGNWGQIAAIGQQIHHSYILKKKLTAKQRHELHQQLPAEFKRLDHKLHQYAKMLSHVAHERDIELVNYYVYKMNETCTSCHSRFVTDKFAGFKLGNKHHQGKH